MLVVVGVILVRSLLASGGPMRVGSDKYRRGKKGWYGTAHVRAIHTAVAQSCVIVGHT